MKTKINIADLIDNDPDDDEIAEPAESSATAGDLWVRAPFTLLAALRSVEGEGSSDAVYLALVLVAQGRMEQRAEGLRLRTSLARSVGLDRFAVHRAARALERAGLVGLSGRGKGRRPLFSLLGELKRAAKV